MISILLADDHQLVRRGIRLALEREPDLRVVAEAPDGMEALTLADAHRPDGTVLDVNMPRLGGLQAARELARGRGLLREADPDRCRAARRAAQRCWSSAPLDV